MTTVRMVVNVVRAKILPSTRGTDTGRGWLGGNRGLGGGRDEVKGRKGGIGGNWNAGAGACGGGVREGNGGKGGGGVR